VPKHFINDPTQQHTTDCGGPAVTTLASSVPAYAKLELEKLTIAPVFISQMVNPDEQIRVVWKGGPETTPGEQTIDIKFDPECALRKWQPYKVPGPDPWILLGERPLKIFVAIEHE
jgi:hypothetical protein